MTEQESAAKQAQQWFVRRGDKEHGPFTSKQLRSMAASGKITVDDLLRKGDSPKWIKAGSVKGLFAAVPQEAKPATSPPIPVAESNAGDERTSKSNNARKIVLGCAGAFVLLMLMCGGLIRLGNMARNTAREVVQKAEQRQAAAPYAQLSGKWRGNDGTVHDLVIHERKENSCEYTDRGVPPSNGQAAKAYFNGSNAFVYFGSGGMRVTGTYQLDGIDRIHITGQGTITRFDGPDVKQPITDTWVREGGNADGDAVESTEANGATTGITFPTFEAASGTWRCRKTGKTFQFKPKIRTGPDGKPGIARMPWVKHEISPFTVTQSDEVWVFEFHQNGVVYAIPERNVDSQRARIGQFTFDGKVLDIKLALTALREEVGKIPWEFEFELARP